jgi:hypothetical protein
MPTGTAERTPPAPHLERARAGRDAATARRKLEKPIAEILSQGYASVILTTDDGRARTYTNENH